MAERELKLDRVETVLSELVTAATWTPSPGLRERLNAYRAYFRQVATESGVRRQMLEAIAIVESSVRPWEKNPDAPAYGLMQIWGPAWFGTPLELPRGPTVRLHADNWGHPLPNLRAGAAILVRYGAGDSDTGWWEILNRYNGDAPPRDDEYENAVQGRYLALVRETLSQ